MKKIIFADFMEFDDPCNKLGNYHYAKCFAKDGYEVLWMSCLYNKLLYFKHPEVYKKRERLSSDKRHKLDENIFGFAVKSRRLYGKYPFCNNPNIVLNNDKYIKKDTKDKLKNIGFLDVDVLWISNPKQFWLTNIINYKKLIFRIPDDFSEFGVFPKGIEIIEKKLIEKSDIVFVTAEKLGEKVKKYGKKPYLLPNGCEIEHFLSSKGFIPSEYKNDKRKKVIYVGAIGEWFDVELVKNMSEKLLDINIYIIGKAKIDLSMLQNRENVKLLGSKPYSDIPNYIKNADLAIIPFINNDFTDRINPIKLFEYFACGVPVVCSNMLEVRRLNSPAKVATNREDFIRKVKDILENCRENDDEFINFAKKNSWSSRYEYIQKIISNLK